MTVLVWPYINVKALLNSPTAKIADNAENIKSYHGHLLLIHGTADDNLPYSMSETLLKNCPSSDKELITIEGGRHEAPFLKENWEKLIGAVDKN